MVEWNEDEGRWFVEGRGVYAGSSMEMQGVVLVEDEEGDPQTEPGKWFEVVIESRDGGRVLDAYGQVPRGEVLRSFGGGLRRSRGVRRLRAAVAWVLTSGVSRHGCGRLKG